MKGHLRRDEDAVSAAVATVLLFGGVLSIIGLMMISMMPVIEEMEGSVERHDMSSQMTLLAHRTRYARRFNPRNPDSCRRQSGVGQHARRDVVFSNVAGRHDPAGTWC